VPVRVITHIQTKPGAGEDFMLNWDRKRYDDVVGLPGCDQYEIFQSALDPDRVYVLENWQSRGAFHSGWKILSVQVPVGSELLAAPTDQPHSGHSTEIYWDLNEIDDASTVSPGGGRLVINENVKQGSRDAYVEAWKAATEGLRAGGVDIDLLLGTRNHENVATLATFSDGAALGEYLKTRNATLSGHLASADERMSGYDGMELYEAPSFSRWDGSEWVAAELTPTP